MSKFVFKCPKLFSEKELGIENKTQEYKSNETDPKLDCDINQFDDNGEPQVYFPPRVNLPLVEIKSLEEDEELVVQMRARIYRYDVDEEDGPEFKERGTGLLKILYNPQTGSYRIVMRRDITYKVCANHSLLPGMKLEYHNNSDKVFLYSTAADLFDGEASPQTFAIRFKTAEIASTFKDAFEESVQESSNREKFKNDNVTDNKDSGDGEEIDNAELKDDKEKDDDTEKAKDKGEDEEKAEGSKEKENDEKTLSEEFKKKIEI